MKLHPGFDSRKVEAARRKLWKNVADGTDVYFPRSYQIFQHLGINPFAQRQMFVRLPKGVAGTVVGIEEVVAVYQHYTKFFANGGRIWAVPIGETFD